MVEDCRVRGAEDGVDDEEDFFRRDRDSQIFCIEEEKQSSFQS